jgi:hypothetical protein
MRVGIHVRQCGCQGVKLVHRYEKRAPFGALLVYASACYSATGSSKGCGRPENS